MESEVFMTPIFAELTEVHCDERLRDESLDPELVSSYVNEWVEEKFFLQLNQIQSLRKIEDPEHPRTRIRLTTGETHFVTESAEELMQAMQALLIAGISGNQPQERK
jgi:hypothetical protein